MSNLLNVKADVVGLSRIDFDKKIIKRTLRSEAGAIRKAARQILSRRAVSVAGQAPGRATGVLQRSIKVVLGSGGFWAKVAPAKTDEMKAFYPAFLFYGTKSIAKRDNYMVGALNIRRVSAQAAISRALREALKPRG